MRSERISGVALGLLAALVLEECWRLRLPLGTLGVQLVVLVSIVLLTALNCRGVRLGAITQNVLTIAKMAALGLLIVAGLAHPGGSAANLSPLWPEHGGGSFAGSLGLALIAVLWAYDGWIEATYVGSEIRDPGRVLPRSIILSTLIVVALYTLASLAYVWVLSPAQVAGSTLVASDAARVTLGEAGAAFVVVVAARAPVTAAVGGALAVVAAAHALRASPPSSRRNAAATRRSMWWSRVA